MQSTITDPAGNQYVRHNSLSSGTENSQARTSRRHLVETEHSFQQTACNTIIPIINRYITSHNVQFHELASQSDTNSTTTSRLDSHGRQMLLEETYTRGIDAAEQAVLSSSCAPKPSRDANSRLIGYLLDRYDPQEIFMRN